MGLPRSGLRGLRLGRLGLIRNGWAPPACGLPRRIWKLGTRQPCVSQLSYTAALLGLVVAESSLHAAALLSGAGWGA